MAPPDLTKKSPVMAKQNLGMLQGKSGKMLDEPMPSALVSEVLKLENQEEIEKKALEIKGKLHSESVKGADRNVALLDELLEAAKVSDQTF